MQKILGKQDCLDHIQSLYGGPSETGIGDQIWLNAITDFGIENLPYDLLKKVAAKMLREEGEMVVFEEIEE